MGLMGTSALCEDALNMARVCSFFKSIDMLKRLSKVLDDMKGLVDNLINASSDLGEGPKMPFTGTKRLTSAPLLRGALDLAIESLSSELSLRRSLLNILHEMDRGEQEELRRVLIIWNE
eukprot:CAMPEP_0206494384 /NCGR_PEP_ID=MMETSP0324_2-20121206/47690_1 /ASSEMBLY_ACC=CAM_ASM_000836 /TAXON_ID=2866 /ORGANISM="Crypthecodinium cohnii, Strain Seligo" /LENGTH=118 /DNA_ID=CAMNT_0053978017 /DNA_START=391 /DNA_END=744 /DNA_ORIENTATION=-